MNFANSHPVERITNFRVIRARKAYLAGSVSKDELRTHILRRRDHYLEKGNIPAAQRVIETSTSVAGVFSVQRQELRGFQKEMNSAAAQSLPNERSNFWTMGGKPYSARFKIFSKVAVDLMLLNLASKFMAHTVKGIVPDWYVANGYDATMALVISALSFPWTSAKFLVLAGKDATLAMVRRLERQANFATSAFTVLCASILEVAQKFHFFPGSFDPLDFVAYVVGGTIAYQMKKFIYHRNSD